MRERSHPQGPDPVWNDEHCRNKRILIDDTTNATVGAVLVHYSTDFVFDGAASAPYSEEDRPNPRSVYGAY